MSHGERLQAGSDSDRLRQEAYEQEAEALREDLVRYFAHGAVLDELGPTLRKAIQDALKQVAKEALQDEEVRRLVRQEVRSTILDGLKNELAVEQPKILAALKKDAVAKWGKNLEEVAVRPDGSGEPEEPDRERRPPTIDSTETRAPVKRWTLALLKFAPLFFSLVAVVLSGWLLLRTPRPGEERPPSHNDDLTTGKTGQDDPAGREDIEDSRQALREEWITRMDAAAAGLPADSSLRQALSAQPPADQFDCWFDKGAVGDLESFLAAAKVDLKALRSSAQKGTFPACLRENYANSSLPIFGVQSIVHVALQRQAAVGWKDCSEGKKPLEVPDLAAFQADGRPGPSTSKLLNAYLACTGFSPQLEIRSDSVAPDYLFTLYLALKELVQGG